MINYLIKIIIYCNGLKLKYLNFFYRNIFKCIGEGTIFLGSIKVYNAGNIAIGSNCSINEGVFFNVSAPLNIADNVTISANSFISTVTLDIEVYPQKAHITNSITIEKDSWIGAGAIILPGIIIGEGSVVGAGAVVTKDVPPNCIYAGNPAKLIKELDSKS